MQWGRAAAATGTLLLLSAHQLACSGGHANGDDGPAPVTSENEVSGTKPQTGTPFERCSLVTGGNDGRAECATFTVPLDWSAADGSTASFFVKRVIGTARGVHRQLWLLQGGPGVAGDGFEPLAESLARNDASLDIYLPDHRGTGRSSKLDCPHERGRLSFDYGACMNEMKTMWGVAGMHTFSTTTAARDVGYVIDQVRTAGQEVHVYGVSYGTYWAQRYLQLFPEQPTAVALDGLCQSGLCSYLKSGYWLDRVGKKYLAECGEDATCGAMLGADPTARVREAIAAAQAKKCTGLTDIDGEALRRVYGWFITSFELRALIPATAYRILRCNTADVAALQRFEAAMKSGAGRDLSGLASEEDLSSEMLGRNIAFSELESDPPPSRAELAGLLADAVFTTPDATIRDEYDNWPRYDRDELVGKYPTSSVPVLMMNGTLDPQTPEEFAENVASHYKRQNQGLVVLPRAAHGVIMQSPVEGPASEPTCGMTLWHQFLTSPTAALDTSCRGAIQGHDFAGSPALAAHFFGTTTLWGNTPADDGGSGTTTTTKAHAGTLPSASTAAGLDAALRTAVRASHPFLRSRPNTVPTAK
ncbi:MAG: uncharacterized protein JWP97_1904 [Labilithrix sp.]|nr:uncharacterized protein [Labilithrix sp.]